ncbi:MAG: ABC transporter substrate-binding protein [Aggregatilineales bacterium]
MREYKPDPQSIKARNDHVQEAHFQYTQKRISRRDFLRFASALGGGAIALGMLSPLERLQVAQARSLFAGDTPQRGGTLHNALGTDAKTRFDDPAKLNGIFPSNNIRQVCDYLVVLDPTLTLQPSLATAWTPSKDGLTWTVTLRQGVKFNHGKTFNADDVVFTFKRLLDKTIASGWAGAANYVSGVEKVDDNTVNFHTNRVAADFIYSLFLYHAAVLPADWPGDFIAHPWGTGPFTLDQFTAGELVRFKARTDYWKNGADGKPLPYLDTLEFDYYTDDAARFSAFQEGSLDMGPANVTLKDQYAPLTDYNFMTVQTGNLDNIVMQFNVDPWTKPQMRQAMKLIVDRAAYVKTRFAGFAIAGDDQPIAPGMYPLAPSSRTPGIQDYAQAKALLAQAGFPNGIDLTATYIDKASDGGFTDQWAQFLVGQAAPAGIRLTLKPDPHYWDTWLKDWGTNTIGLSNWGQKNTASEMFNLAYYSKGIWNETHWVNSDFDALLVKFDSTLDEATRKGQLAQLCDLLSTQGSVMIPGWRQDAAMLRKTIHYTLHPQAFDWFGDLWIASA